MPKLKQLYDNAKKHYRKGELFNSDFAVYEIQLFDGLFGKAKQRAEHDVQFSAFQNILSDWLDHSREFDASHVAREVRDRVNKEGWQKYHVIFGVPVKMKHTTDFPFKRTMKIDDVAFSRKSYSAIRKIDGGIYEKELRDAYKKERYSELDVSRILVKYYVFFEAQTRAPREQVAVNKIHDAFELFTASATMAQERFKTVRYYLSPGIKSRKPILNPYALYVRGSHPNTGVYVASGRSIELPEASIEFTKDKHKVLVYKKFLHILKKDKPLPIEERIKEVSREFDKALSVTDPHLRALSLWRCLEYATRKKDRSTRKQEDIISIIASWRPDEPWKEQGKLILKSRNQFVHEGKEFTYHTRDYYLGWLQEYVSANLALLIWMREHSIGKTLQGIDDFFDMYPRSGAALEVASIMLRAKRKLAS